MSCDPTDIWTCLAHVQVESGPIDSWFKAYARCFVASPSGKAVFDTVDGRLRESPLDVWDEETEVAKPTRCRLLSVEEVEPLLAISRRRALSDAERDAASWALQEGFCACDLHCYPAENELNE
jgi:hypothetical protein